MSKDFSNALKGGGLKNTPARNAILGVFSTYCHPMNAELISNKLKKSDINLVTIYRTLESLEEVGILKRVDLHKKATYYELSDRHHHHLICTKCGTVESFEMCDIRDLTRKALKGSGFQTVSNHSLELFGMCKKCA